MEFDYAGESIPVELSVGWSPGRSGYEQKSIYLNDSHLFNTPRILGQSTAGWWNEMPRYVHSHNFELVGGEHTLTFYHLEGDGTLWDFVKLERR